MTKKVSIKELAEIIEEQDKRLRKQGAELRKWMEQQKEDRKHDIELYIDNSTFKHMESFERVFEWHCKENCTYEQDGRVLCDVPQLTDKERKEIIKRALWNHIEELFEDSHPEFLYEELVSFCEDVESETVDLGEWE